jgi:hypothetical protein
MSRHNGGYTIEIPRKTARNILKLKQAMGEAQKDRRMESKKVKFSQSGKQWEDEDWGAEAPINNNKIYVLDNRGEYEHHEVYFMESDLDIDLVKDIIRIKDEDNLLCVCNGIEWNDGKPLPFFAYLEWTSFLHYHYEDDQYKRDHDKDGVFRALPYNTLKQLIDFWRRAINEPLCTNKLMDNIMACFDEIEHEFKD